MRSRILAQIFLGLSLTAGDGAFGQERADPAPSGGAPSAPPQSNTGSLTQTELEELLAPIALYPDQLLANVLAASLYPDEVAAAAAFVSLNPDPAAIDSQDWEPPVRAVALVSNVIKMMADYPDWVGALGAAYQSQPQEVMKTVQSLRARAKANGALFDTPQQTITTQGSTIVIQPAQPQVIYVPQYDPQVVYVERYDPWTPGFVTFGWGVWTGFLISDLDCDWHHHRICWGHSWHHHHRHNIDYCADVDDWRGRPRPGQEGASWGPNSAKVQADGGNRIGRFQGLAEARSTRSPGVAPFVGPVANPPQSSQVSAASTQAGRLRAQSTPQRLSAGPAPRSPASPASPSAGFARTSKANVAAGSVNPRESAPQAGRFPRSVPTTEAKVARPSAPAGPAAPSQPRTLERSKIPSLPAGGVPKASIARPSPAVTTIAPVAPKAAMQSTPSVRSTISTPTRAGTFSRPTSSPSAAARPTAGPSQRSVSVAPSSRASSATVAPRGGGHTAASAPASRFGPSAARSSGGAGRSSGGKGR